MKPVAVIGGGITGLTAAFTLQRRGIPVRLWEHASRVGGVIQSIRRGDYLAEFGPNSILETSPLIGDLVRDLGLEGRRIYSAPTAEKRYVVRGRAPVALPGTPGEFLRTPLFSLSAKLRLLAEPFISPAPADEEESIAQFVRRRLGQEFLDYAINPMVAGVYAGDPNRLSVRQAFPKLHALEQRYRSLILGQVLGARARRQRGEVSKQNAKKISFDDGLQVLIDALQQSLREEISASVSIQGMQRAGDGWRVAGETCSAVLLALPSHKMASLKIEPAPTAQVASLAEIYYPPVASVVLGFRREDVKHPLDGFGMLVPEKEGFDILGALFSSTLFPQRAPDGHVTITCYLGGARSPGLPRRTPEELAALAVKDLGAILGGCERPTFQHVTIYRQAIPQYNVGFGKFRAVMDEMERTAPGLFVAGHARDGISLGDSIVSGSKAAERIQSYLHLNHSSDSLITTSV
ncbi:MAG TPA: protoporphyrinogen oxidase [Verrucomicrobiae bacterium]|jgi:oxygen-dependent protoporphyrinogen oxidase|nr:protoporphyrinogen oxidase [Verrucomicrobiae bacterium]